MRDHEIKPLLSDLQAVALTIFGESASEPIEGKVAVGCVIRNRVNHPKRYGSTYSAVCHARAQFSCWFRFGGAENYTRLMAMAKATVTGKPLPLEAWGLDVYQECVFVAEGIIGGQLRDRVGKSTHYMTRALWTKSPPEWVKGLSPSASVGSHDFFSGVN
jgi:N-acetylmuramoyl-L-alanine amidase